MAGRTNKEATDKKNIEQALKEIIVYEDEAKSTLKTASDKYRGLEISAQVSISKIATKKVPDYLDKIAVNFKIITPTAKALKAFPSSGKSYASFESFDTESPENGYTLIALGVDGKDRISVVTATIKDRDIASIFKVPEINTDSVMNCFRFKALKQLMSERHITAITKRHRPMDTDIERLDKVPKVRLNGEQEVLENISVCISEAKRHIKTFLPFLQSVNDLEFHQSKNIKKEHFKDHVSRNVVPLYYLPPNKVQLFTDSIDKCGLLERYYSIENIYMYVFIVATRDTEDFTYSTKAIVARWPSMVIDKTLSEQDITNCFRYVTLLKFEQDEIIRNILAVDSVSKISKI